MEKTIEKQHQVQLRNTESLLPTSLSLANFSRLVENKETNGNRKALISQANRKVRLWLILVAIINSDEGPLSPFLK